MRWLVEVVSLGKSEKESLHVEAESWQKALQKARGQRGDASPLSGFSIELLDDGCRAVDPAARLRYEVRRAADAGASVPSPSVAARSAVEASAPRTAPRPSSEVPRPRDSAPAPPVSTPPVQAPHEEASAGPTAPGATEAAPVSSAHAGAEPYAASPSAPPPPMPPSSAPASVPAPTRSTAPLPRSDGASDSSRPSASSSIYPPPQPPSASPSSPPPPSSPRAENSRVPSQIIFKREHEATEATPLTYREYVFLVALGTSEEAAEALLTSQLELVLASLARVPPGKLVNLGVFDVAFQGKPTVLPLATLTWKDWRGTPVVEFPRRPGFRPRASSPMPPAAPPPAVVSAAAPPAPVPSTQRPAVTLSIPPPPLENTPPALVTPVAPSAPPPAPPPVAAGPTEEAAPAASPPAATPPAAPAPAPPSEAAPPTIPEEAPAATEALPATPAAPPSPPTAVAAPAEDVPAVPEAPPAPPPLAEAAPAPPPAPSSPARSSGHPRTRGEDLITALFESMHDLHFLRDAVEGGDFCLNLAMEKMPSQAGMVHLYDINRREFLVTSTRGASAGALLLRRHAETDAMLSVAMVRRRAVVVADASETGAPSMERYAAIGGARSVIIAPVMQAGRFLGAIELLNPLDGQPFTEAEGNALNYIAEQFAEFVAARGVVTDPARIGSTTG